MTAGVFDMSVTTIGYALAGLIGVGIVFIGARFILAPRAAAAGYGVQPDLGQPSVGAYLSVKGVRDVASGLFVFILMAAGATHLLGWVILAATIIPFTDATIVLGHGGSRSIALGAPCLPPPALLLTAWVLPLGSWEPARTNPTGPPAFPPAS